MFLRVISLLIFVVAFSGCKTETLNMALNTASKMVLSQGDPTKQEIGLGLKEALSVSIEKGARSLALKDGYLGNNLLKILLPKEIQSIEKTLGKIGLGKLTNELTMRLNRAAEDAAIKSVPIFKDAILNMSFKDVMSVLTGPKDSATQYLSRTTSQKIAQTFAPQIQSSLNKVGAVDLWREIFTKYNSVPFVKKVNTDLVGYTTNQALKGLFLSVSQREGLIRKNAQARTTPLLQKVFSYADRL